MSSFGASFFSSLFVLRIVFIQLVGFSAPPGLEDAQDAPTAGPLPVLNENDSETSGSGSRTSFYRAETPSPQNVPLLENHDSHDGGTLSPQSSRNSGGDGRRASMGVDETGVLGHAHSLYTMPTLSPAENQGRDSRGEAPPYSAPPYFEAILSGPIEEHHPDTTIQLGQEDPEPRRRSGFRGLLQALNLSTHSRVPTSPPTSQENPTSPPPGHNRVNSSFSVTSSLSHALPNPNRLSNRPHSPFRTLTHQRSYTAMNMNSSTLSVNSISAPLTHTLMRSDFTYPKSGPTPDQVRLISSPESITRFGIPYGPAAIAFAASNSRQDLHPPPDFDAVEGLRVRGTSRAAIGSFHQRGSSDASSGISHQQRRESNISSISSSSQLPASAPSPAETETANATLVETATVPTIAERRSHSPSAASHTGGGGGGGGKADENASAPTMAAHSPLTMDTTSSPSLRSAQLLPSRAESRASSLTSYATAAETLRVSSEESEISTPSTPRNAPMHIRGTSITV